MSETGHKFDDFALTMTRGDELKLNLAVKTIVDDTESAQDISTGTVRIIGKKSLSDSDDDAVFDLDNGDTGGIVTVSAPDGTAQATIAPDKTAGLPSQTVNLYVRCLWTTAAGKPHTFRTGMLAVRPG